MLNKKLVLAAALFVVLCSTRHALAQDASIAYPKMASVEQYLMDRDAEIALARTAAPEAISRDASVLVLTRHGFETAVTGKSGWVCMVARGWEGMFDHPDFWNPRIRAAGCFNPPAARSVLPYDYKRAELVMAGRSKQEIITAMKVSVEKKVFPALEAGGICYMMSKTAYLFDGEVHAMPHVMFYLAEKEATAWGANLPNSPVMGVNFWSFSGKGYPELNSFPPLSVYLVMSDKWSDGTQAMHM